MILPVHFGGLASNIDKIQKICAKSKIFLVEDAAHASGSKFHGKKIGTHGSAVCFSFHPVKNLAMPTGGAITLNGQKNGEFKKILQSKRWCGISSRKGVEYDVSTLGWNYYMNEFSATIGLEQLKKLDRLNSKRKQIAKRYFNEIKFDIPDDYSSENFSSFDKLFEELKGKIVTVQYFEETLNEEGNYSLRFPVVKHIYSGSRDC